jgi:hypothetical protein
LIRETSAIDFEARGDGTPGRGAARKSSGVSRSTPQTSRRRPGAEEAADVQEPMGGQPAGRGLAGPFGRNGTVSPAIEFSAVPSAAADCCNQPRWSHALNEDGMYGLGGLRGLPCVQVSTSETSLGDWPRASSHPRTSVLEPSAG